MSLVTVLIARADPQTPFLVVSVDTRTGDVATVGESTLQRTLPGGALALVLPGSDVQVRRLAIPARTEAQARAAAPYLFEGVVADQIEGMHFAIGAPQNDAGERLVAAISTARLQAWLDACKQLGGDPDAIYVDCTVWPTPAAGVDIIEIEDRCIVAGGALGGYTIEPDLAPALFRQWLAQAGAVTAVRLGVYAPAAWSGVLAGAPAPQALNDALPVHTLARAAADATDATPDLRQGAFARKAEQASGWRLSRVLVAVLLIAFTLQAGALGLAGYRDRKAADDTIALATRDLRAARPDVTRIVNLRAQVSALRNTIDRSGGHPVLSVNEALIATLKAHPQVQLDEVRHMGPGRKVSLRVSATETAALDSLAAALKDRKLVVEARGTQPVEGRYSAELVVDAP
ncbi:MAG: type II secretion system protein GspL [Hyphomonadaceae bacterium]|nr:type II secretion system protein GspL [Hyphomonadaceae bacterium]